MASERIERSTYVEGAWNPSPTGTHITLPLDAALLDDAAVEVLCREIHGPEWETFGASFRSCGRAHARAALAAYAAHVAEVRDGQ